jgi:hypothetical protein
MGLGDTLSLSKTMALFEIVICVSRSKSASGRGAAEARKRHFLAEVHIKFFTRPHELQNKRHPWKNYKFILYLPLSNR